MKPPMTLVELAADLARRLLPEPLYRGLRRKTWMPRVNPKRKARRDAEAFGQCANLARLLPCCACGKLPPSIAAHVESRGAGGKDRANVAPLCATDVARGVEGCHDRQHRTGIETFQRELGVDLEREARLVARITAKHDHEDWPDVTGQACAICETPIEDPTA